jgi:hypothetical protein
MPTLDLLRQIAADARTIVYTGAREVDRITARRILANAEAMIEKEAKQKGTVEDGRD